MSEFERYEGESEEEFAERLALNRGKAMQDRFKVEEESVRLNTPKPFFDTAPVKDPNELESPEIEEPTLESPELEKPVTESFADFEKDKEPITYPTNEEVISKMKDFEKDKNKWTDETIYDAISEWDDKYGDDPNWFNDEDYDKKDELRDAVEVDLGWEDEEGSAMDYFLGPDPKKTDYYKMMKKRNFK